VPENYQYTLKKPKPITAGVVTGLAKRRGKSSEGDELEAGVWEG